MGGLLRWSNCCSRRTVRTLVTAIVLLTCAQARGADAASDVDTTEPGVIAITVNVELSGNASPELIARWDQAFDTYWGGDQTAGCWTLRLDANFVSGGQGGPEYHVIAVVPTRPGQDFRSGVTTGSGYLPGEHNAGGEWGSLEPDRIIAHEMGHLMGLPDEYVDFDANGNVVPRGEGVRSGPDPAIPDSATSLMGVGNNVLSRHLTALLDAHFPFGGLDCSWTGTLEHTGFQDASGGTLEFTVTGTLVVQESLDGVITGSADVTLAYENISKGETCVGGRAWHDPIPAQYSVTGTRQSDDSIVLRFTAVAPVAVTLTANCPSDGITVTQEHGVFWEFLTFQPGQGILWPPTLQPDDANLVMDAELTEPTSYGTRMLRTTIALERLPAGTAP